MTLNQISLGKGFFAWRHRESVSAPAGQLGRAFAAVAAKIKPAVVSVYSERWCGYNPRSFPFLSAMSSSISFSEESRCSRDRATSPGNTNFPNAAWARMILDKQGHILTNYRVVSEVDEIKVQLADKRNGANLFVLIRLK